MLACWSRLMYVPGSKIGRKMWKGRLMRPKANAGSKVGVGKPKVTAPTPSKAPPNKGKKKV